MSRSFENCRTRNRRYLLAKGSHMAYVRPSDKPPIDRDTLTNLARLVGLTLPDEDIEPLAAALRDQFAAAESLENLDLTDVTPAFRFDARWHD
jgi:hypothetical protein